MARGLAAEVTGSNSVNVYLGIGIPWLAAAVYWASGVGSLGWGLGTSLLRVP